MFLVVKARSQSKLAGAGFLMASSLLAFSLSGCSGGDSAYGARSEFTLSGTVTYDDREYAQLATDVPRYGFTRTVAKPVRFATVQVVNERGKVVAISGTDDRGHYTVSAAGGSAEPMRVRVLARTDTGAAVSLRDYSGNVLSISTPFQSATAQLALDVAVNGDLAGAFNMLDVYAAAGEFVKEQSGSFPPALAIRWQPGTPTPMGTTYFCNSCESPTIYVLAGSYAGGATVGDADHFDDDVLLHEYGHFLEQSFGVLDSHGGNHTLLDTKQDLRLAWSEGFSSFMAGAIKDWLAARRHGTLSSTGLPPSFYIDTVDGVATQTSGLYFDFRNLPPPLDGIVRHATSETANAKVLWNLHATSAGMDGIWQAFTNGLRLTSAAYPASLETFWDAWQTSDAVVSKEDALAAFAERAVDYSDDAREPDDDFTFVTRTPYQVAEQHNLFKAALADETDLIPFNALGGTSYRIETYDLMNGADTRLRVKDVSGMTLAENDNTASVQTNLNDGCNLASRIDAFTPQSDGVYFAEITRPALATPSAGRYGGYGLNIVRLPSDSAPACS